MPINNVNGMNKIDLVKLAMSKKTGQTQRTQTPAYLTKQGSIFNAPELQKPPTLAEQNVKRSLDDMTGAPKTTTKSKKDDGENTSPSEGKASIASVGTKMTSAKSLTSTSEKGGRVADKIGNNAERLQGTIKKDEKTFNKNLKLEQKNYQKTQAQMQKMFSSIDANALEINSIQSELATLTAGDNTGVGSSSAFSLKLGGEVQNSESGGSSSNSERIAELQGRLGKVSSLGQTYGAKINTLSSKSSRAVRNMDRMSRSYAKAQAKNQKQIQNNQKETSNIIKIAEKTDQISQLVSVGGQTVEYLGQGMQMIGQAMQSNPYTAAAGAVMVTIGTGMQKFGKVAQLVGQYGSTAANATKAVAYATEGNLKGALMSAGAAIQSGCAAAKSTKSFKSDMKALNATAQDAAKKADAMKEAKSFVKDQGGKIEGMTDKQAIKSIAAERLNGAETLETAKGNVTDALTNEKINVDSQMTSALDAKGKTVKNAEKFENKVNKQAAKNVSSNAKQKISSYGQAGAEVAKKSQASEMYDQISKYGQSLTQMASMLPDSNSGTRRSGGMRRMPLSPSSQAMIARRRARTANISRMYAA